MRTYIIIFVCAAMGFVAGTVSVRDLNTDWARASLVTDDGTLIVLPIERAKCDAYVRDIEGGRAVYARLWWGEFVWSEQIRCDGTDPRPAKGEAS